MVEGVLLVKLLFSEPKVSVVDMKTTSSSSSGLRPSPLKMIPLPDPLPLPLPSAEPLPDIGSTSPDPLPLKGTNRTLDWMVIRGMNKEEVFTVSSNVSVRVSRSRSSTNPTS